ncbi:MAG: cation diffusion facilitator family transporter [Candidatus Lernaella stagnicola]|nr:cation diffusion facilitator family transporter [Candidatus Lernaella stagnicola]
MGSKTPHSVDQMGRRKRRVAMLSVFSNTLLVIGKLVAGLAIGSVSMISEAIHSTTDLVAALMAWFAVSNADKPPDHDHAFGHGKFESLSGAVEALLIFLAAIWIIVEAVQKLLHPHELGQVAWGVGVMLVATITNVIVSSLLMKVGKETESLALQADAWHLSTDALTSAGVMVGLGVIWLGRWLNPAWNLVWIDPVVAIGMALIIIHAAYRLTKQAVRDLIDASLPEAEVAAVREIITSYSQAVRGYHKLKTRRAGPYRFVEFHVQVDASMSVEEAHSLADGLEEAIRSRLMRSSVTVHIEPCDGQCDAECHEGCLHPEKPAPPS